MRVQAALCKVDTNTFPSHSTPLITTSPLFTSSSSSSSGYPAMQRRERAGRGGGTLDKLNQNSNKYFFLIPSLLPKNMMNPGVTVKPRVAVGNRICLYGGSLFFSDSAPFIMKTLLIKFRIDKSLKVCLPDYIQTSSQTVLCLIIMARGIMRWIKRLIFACFRQIWIYLSQLQIHRSRRGMTSVCLSSDSGGAR